MPRATHLALLVFVVACTAWWSAAAPARAVAASCPAPSDFACSTLRVPLDHGGDVSGTLDLRYARQRRGPSKVLLALAGGPGQPGVAAASTFGFSLGPALSRYRLVTLDQRGTGASGTISCPSVQGLRALDAVTADEVAACATRTGPTRDFYGTADSVLDIEALRKRLGVEKIALMGISYGTYVALQYARAFPDRVDRLILDSVVGPGDPDAFLLDTYARIPRVLREQCAHSACDGITEDPVADVQVLVTRLASGPMRGRVFDTRGRTTATSFHDAQELVFLLMAGDFNPYLQAGLPAALAAARGGDDAPLLRLRRIAQGTPLRLSELSFGLNVLTSCADSRLPYALSAPLADRAAAVDRALTAIPPARYAPFDPATVLGTSTAADCARWPVGRTRPPFTGPLPDVPALILGGRLDLRTPIENGLATARQLPRASVVTLRGGGHDVLDTDLTGCAELALDRFIDGRRVGRPCSSVDNGVEPVPVAPRTLADVPEAPGVPGRRGRAVLAVLDTVADARTSALQAVYAGLAAQGGGLRGGRYVAQNALDGRIALRNYAYVGGVRVTGTLGSGEEPQAGSFRVRGRGIDGTLVLDGRGGARGRLGGRRVSYRPSSSSARAARARGAEVSAAARAARRPSPSRPAPRRG